MRLIEEQVSAQDRLPEDLQEFQDCEEIMSESETFELIESDCQRSRPDL